MNNKTTASHQEATVSQDRTHNLQVRSRTLYHSHPAWVRKEWYWTPYILQNTPGRGAARVTRGAAGGDLMGRLSLVSPDVPPDNHLRCLPSTTATLPFHSLLCTSNTLTPGNHHLEGRPRKVSFILYLSTQEHSRVLLDRSGPRGTRLDHHHLMLVDK